jgi:hypothetical protein
MGGTMTFLMSGYSVCCCKAEILTGYKVELSKINRRVKPSHKLSAPQYR